MTVAIAEEFTAAEKATIGRARRRLCDPRRDTHWDGEHDHAARQALTMIVIHNEVIEKGLELWN